MSLFSRIFHRRIAFSIATVMERRRLGSTMPGQTAAVCAARLGHSLL